MKIRPREDDLREVVGMAVHECSHLAVAKKVGFVVTRVTVDEDSGETFLRSQSPGFARMCVFAAGFIGEAQWLNRHYGVSMGAALRYCEEKRAQSDMRCFKKDMRQCGLERDPAIREATRIVSAERSFVERMAVRLAEKGKLTWWDL